MADLDLAELRRLAEKAKADTTLSYTLADDFLSLLDRLAEVERERDSYSDLLSANQKADCDEIASARALLSEAVERLEPFDLDDKSCDDDDRMSQMRILAISEPRVGDLRRAAALVDKIKAHLGEAGE